MRSCTAVVSVWLFSFSRVKISRQVEGHILSRLTIKSAIIEDSGNYTCVLPATNYSDTVRLVVVSGERETPL